MHSEVNWKRFSINDEIFHSINCIRGRRYAISVKNQTCTFELSQNKNSFDILISHNICERYNILFINVRAL